MRVGRKAMTLDALREQRVENFWSRVDVRGPDDCWEWKRGGATRRGYGMVKFYAKADRGKTQLAHRFSYELAYGPIPKGNGIHGTVIAHSCDNPRCVNPKHLRACTQAENLRECLDKGRGNKAFGERSGRAKLTEHAVALVRERIRSGRNAVEISAEFKVHQQNIREIAAATVWKHLDCMRDGALVLTAAPRGPRDAKPNSGSFKKGSKGNPGAKFEWRTIDYAEAKRLHSEGRSIREVARLMNTTHTTVRRALGAG